MMKGFGGRSALSLGMRMASFALSFGVGILATRWLGPELYGRYALLITLGMTVGGICIFGRDRWLVREVATLCAEGRASSARALRRRECRRGLLAAVLTALATVGVVWVGYGPQYGLWLGIFFMVTGRLVIGVDAGYLQGLDRPLWAQSSEHLVRPALFVVILAVALFSGRQASLEMAVLGFAVTLVLAAAGQRILIAVADGTSSSHPAGTLPPFALAFGVLAVLGVIDNNLAVIATGWFASPEEAGYFHLALRGSLLLAIPATAIGAVAMPRLASLHASSQHEALQAFVRKYALGVFAVTLIPGIFLLSFARPLVQLLYGEEFLPVVPALLALTAGRMLAAAAGPAVAVLVMTGRETGAVVCLVVSIATVLLLTAVFVPIWGAFGAALANAVAFVFAAGVGMLLAQRRSGILTLVVPVGR